MDVEGLAAGDSRPIRTETSADRAGMQCRTAGKRVRRHGIWRKDGFPVESATFPEHGSYTEDIIEPAVRAAGVECIHADKIVHSTVIDKPLFEQLLTADVVIADLSTSNADAIYELGVRHALRPHATIVIAEDQFKFPFDFSHLSIAKYVHMGKEIGFREVLRMQAVLQQKIASEVRR
jgi:hypothetical protein